MVPFHTKVQLPVFNWKKLSPSSFSADTALVLKSNVVLALFSQVFPQCVHFGGWSVLSLPFPTSRKCESVCVLGYFYQPFQCTIIFNLFSCQSVTGKLLFFGGNSNKQTLHPVQSPSNEKWKHSHSRWFNLALVLICTNHLFLKRKTIMLSSMGSIRNSWLNVLNLTNDCVCPESSMCSALKAQSSSSFSFISFCFEALCASDLDCISNIFDIPHFHSQQIWLNILIQTDDREY